MISLKAMPKQCNKCKSVIIPPRERCFEGEVVPCTNCKTSYTYVSRFGLGCLEKGDGAVSSGIRFLRYLDTQILYKLHLTAYDLIYFDDEDLAERYSETLRNTGTTVSWYGESLIRGRSPEEDIIREGVEMFAVSR